MFSFLTQLDLFWLLTLICRVYLIWRIDLITSYMSPSAKTNFSNKWSPATLNTSSTWIRNPPSISRYSSTTNSRRASRGWVQIKFKLRPFLFVLKMVHRKKAWCAIGQLLRYWKLLPIKLYVRKTSLILQQLYASLHDTFIQEKEKKNEAFYSREQWTYPQISSAFQDFWQIMWKEGRLNWI